ncbi:MAG: TetR/AcrR family transcriptional regulator [Blastocatellia bacterium]|nr:TetR/AcrR family transcriptional regulator [Blastocatellia bacterium]
MGIAERRERQKENLRQEILDVAREMFATEGYESVSMRKIADKIEYSPTTIYLYFKDKNDLLYQICEETFAQLGQEIRAISEPETDLLVRLYKGLRAYIEFGIAHPHHYKVTFMNPLFSHPTDEYHFEGSMGERTFDFLRSEVATCMQAGVIRSGDVDAISQAIWAGIHGTTSLLIGHTEFPFVERNKLIDTVINTMIAGLKA